MHPISSLGMSFVVAVSLCACNDSKGKVSEAGTSTGSTESAPSSDVTKAQLGSPNTVGSSNREVLYSSHPIPEAATLPGKQQPPSTLVSTASETVSSLPEQLKSVGSAEIATVSASVKSPVSGADSSVSASIDAATQATPQHSADGIPIDLVRDTIMHADISVGQTGNSVTSPSDSSLENEENFVFGTDSELYQASSGLQSNDSVANASQKTAEPTQEQSLVLEGGSQSAAAPSSTESEPSTISVTTDAGISSMPITLQSVSIDSHLEEQGTASNSVQTLPTAPSSPLTSLSVQEKEVLNKCLTLWPNNPFASTDSKGVNVISIEGQNKNNEEVFRDTSNLQSPTLSVINLSLKNVNKSSMNLANAKAWYCVSMDLKNSNKFKIQLACRARLMIIGTTLKNGKDFEVVNSPCS